MGRSPTRPGTRASIARRGRRAAELRGGRGAGRRRRASTSRSRASPPSTRPSPRPACRRAAASRALDARGQPGDARAARAGAGRRAGGGARRARTSCAPTRTLADGDVRGARGSSSSRRRRPERWPTAARRRPGDASAVARAPRRWRSPRTSGAGDVTSRGARRRPARARAADLDAKEPLRRLRAFRSLARVYRAGSARVARRRCMLAEGDRGGVETPCSRASTGAARALLAGERVVLNLLQHLSGVATLTRALRRRASPGTRLVDRRHAEDRSPASGCSRSTRCATGGGVNHRFGARRRHPDQEQPRRARRRRRRRRRSRAARAPAPAALPRRGRVPDARRGRGGARGRRRT